MALEKHFNPLIEALFSLPIPVVAAVNGPAAGAGCSLALAADFVVAARSAYFLQAFVNVGLIPDAGATWLLPQPAGRARAMEMMMLGERIPAETAFEWGMIARLVEDEELAEERPPRHPAGAGTDGGARADPPARPQRPACAAERGAGGRADGAARGRQHQDFKAAVFAFLQKRQPRFDGR